MMRRLFPLALLLLAAAPASAALGPATLNEVALDPPPGASLPAESRLSENGRETNLGSLLVASPASVLVFADYTCRSVCGAELAIAAASLADPAMQDTQAGLLVVGLDPKDGPVEAKRMREETLAGLSPAIQARTHFLSADAETVSRLTRAAGYRYRYDPGSDQFAHPAAVLVLAPDGRIARALGGLSLMPETLRKVLIETGEGRIGGLFERIALRCYAFDPATGLYTADARTILRLAGLATLAALAGLVLVLVRRGDRQGAVR